MALENILQKIEDENRKKIEETHAKARKEGEEILKKADADIDKIKKRISDQTSAAIEDERKRRMSIKRLQLKNRLLSQKHEIINNVFDEAFKKIRNLPEKEYLSLIEKLLLAYSEPGEGILYISEEDRERISAEFISRINSSMQEKGKKRSYKLSEENAGIKGGFILKTESLTVDCSLRALFSEAKQNLLKEAGEILFKDG
jgi:V/A-type H+/Na+-transporting ATPase subunit E